MRFNDATVDPAGRLLVTVMASELTPEAASVSRVTLDLSLETVVDGLTTPNGLAVDGEMRRLHFSDSHWDIRHIWFVECDLATGAVGVRTPFADTRLPGGRSDGAAFDDAGRYWIAALNDTALYVYSPDGRSAGSGRRPVRVTDQTGLCRHGRTNAHRDVEVDRRAWRVIGDRRLKR